MDKQVLGILLPFAAFICVTYAIKLLVDARVRIKMLSTGGSAELIQSILLGEEQRHRQASLRWGIVLVFAAFGFGVTQLAGWTDINAGMIAVMTGAIGLGNLVFFTIARRIG
ncbi:hypothetical protein [Dyella subtropica]|uniref:hypothetical protein n=1 Tax=Dyella subtropica TaxID=2992127 RepID=UPI0022595F9D|nr:hypothetical protein [Dyella subtropica]